jgi:hypothetical protein
MLKRFNNVLQLNNKRGYVTANGLNEISKSTYAGFQTIFAPNHGGGAEAPFLLQLMLLNTAGEWVVV